MINKNQIDYQGISADIQKQILLHGLTKYVKLEISSVSSYFGYDLSGFAHPYVESPVRKSLLTIYRENSKAFSRVVEDDKYTLF